MLEGDNLSANISFGARIDRNGQIFAATIGNSPSVAPANVEPAVMVQSQPIVVAAGDQFTARAHTGDSSWILEPTLSFFSAMYWPAAPASE